MIVAVETKTRARSNARPWLAISIATLLAAGCAQDVVEITGMPLQDQAFQDTVYPIILRDCGFPECHGSDQRFYQIFGPGRVRIPPVPGDPDYVEPAPNEVPSNDVLYPARAKELRVTYERTLSMLTRTSTQQDFLLLRKPLEVAAGGAGHLGTDRLGRNVYLSQQDPSWQALKAWAESNAGANLTGAP